MNREHNRARKKVGLAIATGVALALTGIGTAAAQQSFGTITYEEILERPDDLALNLAYAEQEARSGRLQQSAAALERILLRRPNWDSARLFYGIVLYRLGDLKGSVRELNKLQGRDLSAGEEAQRARYLGLAENKSKRLRFSSRYTLGARLDSNPNRIEDDALAITSIGEESDIAATGSSRFRVEYDLNNGRGDYAFFESRGYLTHWSETPEARYLGSRLKAGAVFNAGRLRVSPYAHYGADNLDYDGYREKVGGGLKTGLTLTSQIEAYLNFEYAYEDFDTTDFSNVGSLRNGDTYELAGGIKYRPTEWQYFTFGLEGTRKNADTDDGFSYDEGIIHARSLTLFGKGFFGVLKASYTARDYDQPDTLLFTQTAREDDRFYGRVAVGAPLGALAEPFGTLPDFFADIVAQVGVSYTDQDSNVVINGADILDYENWSGDILFTKRIVY